MDAIWGLLHSISMMIFLSFKDITEEDIDKNIEYLTQYKWFQDFLTVNHYKNLINSNNDVRIIIGSINVKKMSKLTYNTNQQKRLIRELERQLVLNK